MKNKFACLALLNPKSPENVGTILRAAGCYDISTIFYTGNRYRTAKEFITDKNKIHQSIPLVNSDDLQNSVPLGATPVAVELIEGATPLMHYQHPDNAFYIFGPEDGSVNKDVLKWCKDVIYIPTIGCMNLAATVNVVLYDRMAKSEDTEFGDKLIRNSRDNNNNIKIQP